MSILVNGSPMKDFEVGKGLRQGDPLSSFLFVIIVEGLAGLVKKTADLGEFKGFNAQDMCKLNIMQFADDTLVIGERI